MRVCNCYMSSNARRRNPYAARQINPKPGVFFTLILSYPYVSNSLKSFPRSTGHDFVLAVLLTLLWGTIFFWDPDRPEVAHVPVLHRSDVRTDRPFRHGSPLRHDHLPDFHKVAPALKDFLEKTLRHLSCVARHPKQGLSVKSTDTPENLPSLMRVISVPSRLYQL